MRFFPIFLAAAFWAGPAAAHTGVGGVNGFTYGLAHPLGGVDHVLAMVAVGLFACLLKGRALWLVPAAFVTMMAIGGVLGVLALPVPFVELGIGLSVVVIGGLVALGKPMPLAAAMATVGVFAVFHGHAHGAEMPQTLSGAAYGAGFIVATALLHGAGLLTGFGLDRLGRKFGPRLARAAGAAMSATGLAIMAGAL